MDLRTNNRILERSLNKTKGIMVSESIFSFLLGEIVQYSQSQIAGIGELEDRLAKLGMQVGLRLMELHFWREKTLKRDYKIVNFLSMLHSVVWKMVTGKNADSLEISKESEEEYMIVDNEFVLTKYISPPKELSQLNCGALMAGILEAMTNSVGFKSRVSSHSVPLDKYPNRVVFLLKFAKEDIEREKMKSDEEIAMDRNVLPPVVEGSTRANELSMHSNNSKSSGLLEEGQSSLGSDVQKETLEEEPRNIILGLLSQLTKEMDLHRVTFPTFVLEPRSLLERITDFMTHPEYILKTGSKGSEVDRFLDVIKYYLSGWHIRPKGVKKPYNPILGEFFRCKWVCSDGSTSYYIAEQVCHHPPVSAYLYANPENNIIVTGNFRPKGKFLGNSVASIMQGTTHLYFLDVPGEEYVATNPNIYARGILFGTMLMELGDSVTITCEKTNLLAEIEFRVKGYFSGTYNAISGRIKRLDTNQTLYQLSGKWTDKIFINAWNSEEEPEVFIDINTAPICTKIVPPLSEQDSIESQRLWEKVTKALFVRDYDLATEAKLDIEETQRNLARIRDDDGIEWRPKFFRRQMDDRLREPRDVLTKHLLQLMSHRDIDFNKLRLN